MIKIDSLALGAVLDISVLLSCMPRPNAISRETRIPEYSFFHEKRKYHDGELSQDEIMVLKKESKSTDSSPIHQPFYNQFGFGARSTNANFRPTRNYGKGVRIAKE